MQGARFPKAKINFFKNLDLNQVLRADKELAWSATKVVATVGPACQSADTLAKMLECGMVGARFDLTWGPLDFHCRSLDNLQQAMKSTRKLCCTILDTLGRELMIRRSVTIDEHGWPMHEDKLTISAGQTVIITSRPDAVASSTVLPITYSKFSEMAEKGDTIYIGRYLVCGADSASLYLEVTEVKGLDVMCEAKNDAVLDGLLTVFHAERSSDTLLNVQNELPLLSQYDKDCIQVIGREYEIDFVSLSYCRCQEDIIEAREYLDSIGMHGTKILAKIETRQALLSIQGILNEADGIIISRGNLGLDCMPEKMALVQKALIQACNLVGKPVLITRVVDTMVETPRPTRAEATDVANAVLDGVDGILLGAETLRGRYPVEAIETVNHICRSAEAVFDHSYHFEQLMEVASDWEPANGYSRPSTTGPDMGNDEESSDLSHAGSSGLPPAAAAASASATAAGLGPSPLIKAVSFKGMPRTSSEKDVMAAKAPVLPQALPEAHQKMPSLSSAARNMRSNGSTANLATLGQASPWSGRPYLSKLESIASSAVKAADKVEASLIVVFTTTGITSHMVAKYRPPMPILTLVVPHLVSDGLRWRLEGKSAARQCLLCRGLLPVLSAPSPNGDMLLDEALLVAGRMGLVQAHDHVVVVQRVHESFCVKVVSVDEYGQGVMREGSNLHHQPSLRRSADKDGLPAIQEGAFLGASTVMTSGTATNILAKFRAATEGEDGLVSPSMSPPKGGSRAAKLNPLNPKANEFQPTKEEDAKDAA